MKLLRLWLLVLLAVLLPVRGALAAATTCAPAGGGAPAHAMHEGHVGHADMADAAHEHHGEAHADPSDRCNLCSASCAAAPLVRAIPGVAEPRDLTATRYPAVALPAAGFLPGGLERPPRSC